MLKKEAIGTVLGEVTFPVELGKVREFAQAVLADNPEYDRGAPDGTVAPPTFLQTLALWEPEGGAQLPDIGLDYLRVLHGEQEFEYFAPIYVGDELTATSRVSDIYSKPSTKGGDLWFVVFENEFENQRGERVAVSRMTLVQPPKRS